MISTKATTVLSLFLLSFAMGCQNEPRVAGQQPACVQHDDPHPAHDATEARAGATWSDEDSPVPVTSNDPVLGSRLAPVTVVVFGDFECPFSMKLNGFLASIISSYGTQKVRIVWKHFPLPFHLNAYPASVAAETVRALGGDEAFWEFHKKAFANGNALTPENFEKWAAEAGVDVAKFALHQEKNTYAAKVKEDRGIGQTLGVRGTPQTYINGVVVKGAKPVEAFMEIIDAQLAEAQRLLAEGTSPDRIYVEASKKNIVEAFNTNSAPADHDTTVWNVPVGTSPTQGPGDALVTMVVFGQFQCPFCMSLRPTINQLMTDYNGKLRLVYKHHPIEGREDSVSAALFAAEVRKQKGDKGFWQAHDQLLSGDHLLKMENFEKISRILHVNWPAAKKAVEDRTYIAEIEADTALAKSVNAPGTPNTFINGRKISGSHPIELFRKVIDEEIAKAEEMVRNGTPKRAVYDEILKTARTTSSGTP